MGFRGIQPGVCPIDPQTGLPNCPEPTEIDCIFVEKVYDQCVKEDIIISQVGLPEGVVLPENFDISCEIINAFCQVFDEGEPDEAGFRNIVVEQVVEEIEITITDLDLDEVVATFSHTPESLFSEAFLYCPEGTVGVCQLLAATCECWPTPGNDLMCRIKMCKEIQCVAFVKLLVPAYGFCQPLPCEVQPQPDFPCPPENIFPPQLGEEIVPPNGNNNNNNNNNC